MRAWVSVSRVWVCKEAAEEEEAATDLLWRNGVMFLRDEMVCLGQSLREVMDDG